MVCPEPRETGESSTCAAEFLEKKPLGLDEELLAMIAVHDVDIVTTARCAPGCSLVWLLLEPLLTMRWQCTRGTRCVVLRRSNQTRSSLSRCDDSKYVGAISGMRASIVSVLLFSRKMQRGERR